MSNQDDFWVSMRRFSTSIVCRLVALAAALHFALAPALAMSQCGCGDCECSAGTKEPCCCGQPAPQKAAGRSCCGNHKPLREEKAEAPQNSCCQPALALCETAEGCSCQSVPATDKSAIASRPVVKKTQKKAPLATVAAYAVGPPAALPSRILPAMDRQVPPAVARHALLCVWRN